MAHPTRTRRRTRRLDTALDEFLDRLGRDPDIRWRDGRAIVVPSPQHGAA